MLALRFQIYSTRRKDNNLYEMGQAHGRPLLAGQRAVDRFVVLGRVWGIAFAGLKVPLRGDRWSREKELSPDAARLSLSIAIASSGVTRLAARRRGAPWVRTPLRETLRPPVPSEWSRNGRCDRPGRYLRLLWAASWRQERR